MLSFKSIQPSCARDVRGMSVLATSVVTDIFQLTDAMQND